VKAWVVRELGSPDVLKYEDVDDHSPAPDKLRVGIEAAALNFGDLLQIKGEYQVKPDLPFIPGWEIAGTVLAAPDGTGFAPGDRVFGGVENDGLRSGGYAQETDVSPLAAMRIPDEMTFDDAAAFMVIYQTAHFALHRRGNLQPDETLLVHGAAGGVGSAAVQLGKIAGATVIATAGSDEKVELCKELGADVAINYKTQDFAEVVNEHTRRKGADVVFDPVGGDVFERSTKCIAFEGRLVVIGFTSGRVPEVRANHVLVKNYSVVGLHWGLYRSRNPAPILEATQELFDLYQQGKIRPHISARYPLSQAPEALNTMASGKTTGKVILVPDR